MVEEQDKFTEEILGNNGSYSGSAREELMAAIFPLTMETKMRIAFYSTMGYIDYFMGSVRIRYLRTSW